MMNNKKRFSFCAKNWCDIDVFRDERKNKMKNICEVLVNSDIRKLVA
jgi:hypothetical protein